MKITLPITLTPKQKEIDDSPARFKVVRGGRRGGKTYYGKYWTPRQALLNKGKHWYVCQGLDLIRDEMWPGLCEILKPYIVRKDDRLFRMRIGNGQFFSDISCKSGTQENVHRGRGLRSLQLDEASFVKPQLWDRVLRPMLADYRAPALIMSSAKKSWFSNIYRYASISGDADWAAFNMTIYDNPTISSAEIAVIKKTTPVNVWKSEYLGEEVSNVGQVYNEYTNHIPYDPVKRFLESSSLVTVVGMDWGRLANAAALWCGVSSDGKVIVSREHIRNSWDPGRHAGVIKSISKLYSGRLEYVLDQSAFKNESTGISVADQFRKFGVYCQRADKHPDSGINLVKQLLRGDGEKPWLRISSDCPMLLAAIQEWEHGEHEPDILVCLRYAASYMVQRGFLKLSDFPQAINQSDVDPEVMVREFMADHQSRYQLPSFNRHVASNFDWDYENGAPD